MIRRNNLLKNFFSNIDYIAFLSALILSLAGMLMVFSPEVSNSGFFKQSLSLSIAVIIFFVISKIDVYFLKNSKFIYFIYSLAILLFLMLPLFGSTFSGATSWFSFGFFSFQPTDFAKIILIILLAKYFHKRHMEISKIKHLIISGLYTFVFVGLLALQPDLGSAIIMVFIWFGFILIAGVPKRYILLLFGLASFCFFIMYSFFLKPYQINRIETFLNPQLDTLGAGYNIIQANIALGNGGFLGKGFLEGTQSRLLFLPEHDTDFIFSSFGEEWGFLGIFVIIVTFLILIYRICSNAINARTNFQSFFIAGIAIYFFTHFFVHVGINLGLMPVTGTTMPFMSKGGSHLIMEFFALGLVNAFAKTNKSFHRGDLKETDIIG